MTKAHKIKICKDSKGELKSYQLRCSNPDCVNGRIKKRKPKKGERVYGPGGAVTVWEDCPDCTPVDQKGSILKCAEALYTTFNSDGLASIETYTMILKKFWPRPTPKEEWISVKWEDFMWMTFYAEKIPMTEKAKEKFDSLRKKYLGSSLPTDQTEKECKKP